MTNGGKPTPDLDLEDLLNPDEQRRFRRLCLETNQEDFIDLGESVAIHIEQVRTQAGPQTDIDTAEMIAKSLGEILGSGLTFKPAERALLRGAVEYFILADDADPDLDDPLGFDDDARVLNSVLDRIQLPEFKVEPAG